MAEFGGLIINSNGEFVRGFHDNIGYSNILHAEILALMHGMQICWEEDLKDNVCSTYFVHIIHLVKHADISTNHNENEIKST